MSVSRTVEPIQETKPAPRGPTAPIKSKALIVPDQLGNDEHKA